MWIFFILFWLIASYRYMKKNTERIYSPIVWLLIGWFFSFGLYLFSGISYHYGLSIEAGAYYWGVCIAVVIGFKFSQRWRVVFGQRKNIHFIPRIDSITRNSYHLYCGVVILGSFLVVFDIMRLNVISFNLHSNLNISGIGNIGILMSSLGLILWLCECVYAIKNSLFITGVFSNLTEGQKVEYLSWLDGDFNAKISFEVQRTLNRRNNYKQKRWGGNSSNSFFDAEPLNDIQCVYLPALRDVYRYWHYVTGESSREIYRQAPAKTMNVNYLMFHTMDPEMAVEDLKEIYRQKSGV